MRNIPHWGLVRDICAAESVSGVLVTTHPADNLLRYRTSPWPTPELLQKLYASSRFRGATPEDDAAARHELGLYSDLQSLNSEDALTWSVFGTLAYLSPEERRIVISKLLVEVGGQPLEDPPACWLWRRLPHPEKPESNGGPEIDFGFLSANTLVLGEAKWNSPLGEGQGVNRDRTQLDLRVAYCEKWGHAVLPDIQHFVILGVGRVADVFCLPPVKEALSVGVHVCNLSWAQVIECFNGDLRDELRLYLAWKESHSRPTATKSSQTAGAD